jgi:hypothetical protein
MNAPLPRRYRVTLNVPTVVTISVDAEDLREACIKALDRFLATPRLFKRQELGRPAILDCEPLSRTEDPA